MKTIMVVGLCLAALLPAGAASACEDGDVKCVAGWLQRCSCQLYAPHRCSWRPAVQQCGNRSEATPVTRKLAKARIEEVLASLH